MKIKNYILKYLLQYRRPLIIITHLGLIIISYIFSFYLRFEFKLSSEYPPLILRTLPLLILIKMSIFYYFGLFSGLWRYVSMSDLLQIIKANTLSTIIFIIGVRVIYTFIGYPRSVFIIDWLICMGLVSGIRFFTRLLRERFNFDTEIIQRRKKAIIVGAGQAGILTLKECRNNPRMGLDIVGFIDDDPIKQYQNIHGIKVLGDRKKIPEVVDKYGIEEIILAIPSAKGEVIRDILNYCQLPDVKIRTLPRLDKILSGDLEIKPHEVKPEDLLGREPVKIDEKEIESYIKNKEILVTGAGGSIGSELCRQIAKFSPKEIILFDHNENNVYFLEVEFKTKYPKLMFKTIIGDIKDIGLLKHIFSRYRPQVVFHSAAHKHVPLMEENPSAAVKNNVIGSRNLIYASDHYKVERFILISTDKAVNPTSIMGMTKRIAEMIMQAKAKKSKTKFMAVRFGNVIGSDGSVVPLFKKQIEEGGPVTVTHPEAKRYFMTTEEAVLLVLQAGALGKGGEIFILDMGEQIKILDLAKNLITLSGLKPQQDIAIEFTGLRPGEKLSEEILLDTEKDKVTKHNKIYITPVNDFDPTKLRRKIKELERLANIMEEEKLILKIKEIIS